MHNYFQTNPQCAVCYYYFALWKAGKQIVHRLGCKQNFCQVLTNGKIWRCCHALLAEGTSGNEGDYFFYLT